MNTPAIISGIGMLVSGILFVIALCNPPGRPNGPQVGDVYGHVNYGTADHDPRAKPRPFVAIYAVLEIVDGRARCDFKRTNADGSTTANELWLSLDSLRFDTRLFKAPPAAEKP